MRIELTTSNDTRAFNAAAALSWWRAGSILQATAVRDATNGQLWLNVGDRRLPARIASGDPQGPADGERLKLRVLRDSPVLAFEVIESETAADVRGDALRRNLPKQTTPMPLLANLAWLMRHRAGTALPLEVGESLQRLWDNLPQTSALRDPTALADALAKSGVFLEATLAETTTFAQRADIAQRDFKALLLALYKELQPRSRAQPVPHSANEPPPRLRESLTAIGAAPATLPLMDDTAAQIQELARQTEGTLARTVSTQLLNGAAAQSGAPVWLVEIPVRQDERAELLRFRFEQETSAAPEAAPRWSVEVAMDLGANGQLHARVSLQKSRCVVQLRSESPPLVDALNRDAHLLTNALQAEGLLVDRVVCLHGAPIRDAGAPTMRLLDIQA